MKHVPPKVFLKFHHLPGIRKEDLNRLEKINSVFFQTACIDHHHQAVVFFNEQDARYMWKMAGLRATIAELESMGAQCGYCRALLISAEQELCNVYAREVFDTLMVEAVSRGYTILERATGYNGFIDNEASAKRFPRRQALSLCKRWNSYRSLCKRHFRRSV